MGLESIGKMVTKVFGSRNERLVKAYMKTADEANALEDTFRAMPDSDLRRQTFKLRRRLADGESVEAVMPEAFATLREALDRRVGICSVFDPENGFDPKHLREDQQETFEQVKAQLESGELLTAIDLPCAFYDEVRRLYPESRPPFRARLFDVQIVGGQVLAEGTIAEMATGEGKTIVAPLACYLHVLGPALNGKPRKAHVITVNDYLANRDRDWVAPAFDLLGISVGVIQSEMDPGGDDRRSQYACDVTYGTNNEFGFDYLRDNMKMSVTEQVQGPLDFAIVDEVDSILIDEARTPLIISGPAYDDVSRYKKADKVARTILRKQRPWEQAQREVESAKRALATAKGDLANPRRGDLSKNSEQAQHALAAAEKQLEKAEQHQAEQVQYYEVEYDRQSVHLTHEGIQAAQDEAGVGSFYVGGNMEWPHLMEQALRAHVVYEKDRHYVVQQGVVVIVDEFTGRLMVGRQWSDGLHQSVEAKENVTVKEETQTLATITIQNFFKMYNKLAGMTGTALTEADEFTKIYHLDVVAIPTNRPVIRPDFNDMIFRTEQEKWDAIVEEIRSHYESGRPVLVGTTSIENSEKLADMLTKKYGIPHEVLNAKPENAAREAEIVAKAGWQHKRKTDGRMCGNVTIATNMAGRGTDIKLGLGVMLEVELRDQWAHDPRLKPGTKLDVEVLDAEGLGRWHGPGGIQEFDVHDQSELDTIEAAAEKQHVNVGFGKKTLDLGECLVRQIGGQEAAAESGPVQRPPVMKKRRTIRLGGLHIVGTERHEARRIDNQLRGRSGRQGDPGSSRFFLSLQDDLLRFFAGDWIIKVLGWLGMEEGMSIEDKRVSKGIERAQKKVEERNFSIRKHLLDMDEVLNWQRKHFYTLRQGLLEGRDLDTLIREAVERVIDRAVDDFLAPLYGAVCIAKWARNNMDLEVDPKNLEDLPFDEMVEYLKDMAKDEVVQTISVTLGEYMDEDREPDLKGLSRWAMSRFQVNLPQNKLRDMTQQEVEEELTKAAREQLDKRDLGNLTAWTDATCGRRALTAWSANKFGVELTPDEIADLEADACRKLIHDRVNAAYARREIEYPVDYALDMAVGLAGTDNAYAAERLAEWANKKFTAGWDVAYIQKHKLPELRRQLVALNETWMHDGKLIEEVDTALRDRGDPEQLAGWAKERFGQQLCPDDLRSESPEALRDRLLEVGRGFFRRELTELERYVLLQLHDACWKDHLLAMDHLRDSIGLRGYAEKDPKIEFQREGMRMFDEMLAGVEDKITDAILKVRLSEEEQMRSVWTVSQSLHDEFVAHYEPADDDQSAQATGEPQVAKTIRRDQPKVGRNAPCPCGSGEKFKKCCGK